VNITEEHFIYFYVCMYENNTIVTHQKVLKRREEKGG
jgi:hypothetical protein